jgi:ABC-type antimicrobial peptide transport system permease subunit
MGIGASIFLIALGLILALAVEFDVAGLNIQVIGWILVLVGIVGLVLTMFIWGPRRRASRADVVEERRVYDDRPPL